MRLVWQAVVVLHAIKPRVSGAARSRPSALWASKARLERQTRNRDGGRPAPPAAAAKLQKKNDGVAAAAHAFLFALLALASLGLGRLYVLLGAVACTCVTFVVARRAPATEQTTKPSSGSVDDDDDKRPRWERSAT